MAVSEEQLCFSRQLRGFAINGLGRNESWPTEKFDELTLQIQRSLDYLMAQLKLGEAATSSTWQFSSPLLEPLVHHLADNFSFPVTALANGAVVVGLGICRPMHYCRGVRHEAEDQSLSTRILSQAPVSGSLPDGDHSWRLVVAAVGRGLWLEVQSSGLAVQVGEQDAATADAPGH